MAKCVFCGESATKMNDEDQPVCREHKSFKPMDVACPDCGMPMTVREGGNGYFWGCKGYPQCSNTFDIEEKIPDINK